MIQSIYVIEVNKLNTGDETLKFDFSPVTDCDAVKRQLVESNKQHLTAELLTNCDEFDFFGKLFMTGSILFFVSHPKAEDWVACWRQIVVGKKIFVNLYHKKKQGKKRCCSAKVDTGGTSFRGRTMKIMASEPIFVQWFADVSPGYSMMVAMSRMCG